MADLIDSYDESNYATFAAVRENHPSVASTSAIGQALTNGATPYFLTSAKFYLKRIGTPDGDLRAVLYASSGTVGTNAVPTGAALSTSDTIAASAVGTAAFELITFTFDGTYKMLANTDYCIVCEGFDGTNWGASHKIAVGLDNTSPTHGGNYLRHNTGSWGADSGVDTIFYIYGNAALTLSGVTRDASGAILGSCTVWLFKTSDKSFVGETTSNAVTGVFSFSVVAGAHFIRAFKDGVPNVFGTTDDDLAGV